MTITESAKLDKIFKIANNVIYFDDNIDYLTALYEICDVIKPDDESVGEAYIE
jgi:hypothetical protein